MRILVTAGNTQTLLDQVRCITNIFTGRTGTRIALTGHARGHTITLLTSHPRVVKELTDDDAPDDSRWEVLAYRTFEELRDLMSGLIAGGNFDAIIHSAAVSDYHLGGAYVPSPGTHFDVMANCWNSETGPAQLVDASAGKMKSHHAELWLRLVPTPKLVDQIRQPWGFKGVLVKFKLEVGLGEAELLDVAERSRCQSSADLMVANTLEESQAAAYLGPFDGAYQRVDRRSLANQLLQRVENLHEGRARQSTGSVK